MHVNTSIHLQATKIHLFYLKEKDHKSHMYFRRKSILQNTHTVIKEMIQSMDGFSQMDVVIGRALSIG